jgi:uncharacterized protein (TIGR00369 family)
MDVVEDGYCFVCGPLNPTGLRAVFRVDPATGRASSRLVIPTGFQGWQNLVHGGVIAALLDEAAVYACRSGGGQFVTAELTVRYRQPVPVGAEVTVVGEIVEKRKRVVLARARLEIDDTVHAEAEARLVKV